MFGNQNISATESSVALGNGATGNNIMVNDTKTIVSAMKAYNKDFIKLEKKLKVNDKALKQFFEIIQHEQVPRSQLPNVLSELAQKYREALDNLALSESGQETLETSKLYQAAIVALKDGRFNDQRDLIKSVIDSERKEIQLSLELEEEAKKRRTIRQVNIVRGTIDIALSCMMEYKYNEAKDNFEELNLFFDQFEFAKHSELDIWFIKFLNEYGQFYLTTQQYTEAAEKFNLGVMRACDHEEIKGLYSILLSNLGKAQLEINEVDSAIKSFKEALKIDKRINHDKAAKLAIRNNNLGVAYTYKGEFEEAEFYLQTGIGKAKQAKSHYIPEVAAGISNLAKLHSKRGDLDKAKNLFQEAYDFDREFISDNELKIALRLVNLGCANLQIGNTRQAITEIESALEIEKRVLNEYDVEIATTCTHLTRALSHANKHAEALEIIEQALSIYIRNYNEKDRRVAICLFEKGKVLVKNIELKKGLQDIHRSLIIYENFTGIYQEDELNIYDYLGSFYLSENNQNFTEARDYFNKALKIIEAMNGRFHPIVSSVYRSIGRYYDIQKKYSKSHHYFLKAIALDQENVADDYRLISLDRLLLAEAAYYTSKFEQPYIGNSRKAKRKIKEARQLLQMNERILQGKTKEYDETLGGTYNMIGVIHFELNEFLKAAEYYQKALILAQSTLDSNHPKILTFRRHLQDANRELADHKQ